MYRDETETLRAELERVRAELATLKSEPREADAIEWFDRWGRPLSWVESTKRALLGSAGITAFGAMAAESNGYHSIAIVLAVIASGFFSAFLRVWWHVLPRTKVKR